MDLSGSSLVPEDWLPTTLSRLLKSSLSIPLASIRDPHVQRGRKAEQEVQVGSCHDMVGYLRIGDSGSQRGATSPRVGVDEVQRYLCE